MPKPYSILAAAFVANGRGLSTAIIRASTSDHTDRPAGKSNNRFAGPDRSSSFDFESAFARDPFAERAAARAVALAA